MDTFGDFIADEITNAIIANDTLFSIVLLVFVICIALNLIIGTICHNKKEQIYILGIRIGYLSVCSTIAITSALFVNWIFSLPICIVGSFFVWKSEKKEILQKSVDCKPTSLIAYTVIALVSFGIGQIIVYMVRQGTIP